MIIFGLLAAASYRSRMEGITSKQLIHSEAQAIRLDDTTAAPHHRPTYRHRLHHRSPTCTLRRRASFPTLHHITTLTPQSTTTSWGTRCTQPASCTPRPPLWFRQNTATRVSVRRLDTDWSKEELIIIIIILVVVIIIIMRWKGKVGAIRIRRWSIGIKKDCNWYDVASCVTLARYIKNIFWVWYGHDNQASYISWNHEVQKWGQGNARNEWDVLVFLHRFWFWWPAFLCLYTNSHSAATTRSAFNSCWNALYPRACKLWPEISSSTSFVFLLLDSYMTLCVNIWTSWIMHPSLDNDYWVIEIQLQLLNPSLHLDLPFAV